MEKGHTRKVTRNFEQWFTQSLMLKAAEDSTKAHASAIEVKSVTDERK